MFDKMKQLMEMKRQADQIKQELDATNIDINVAQGIKVCITGSQKFQSIEIDEDVLKNSSREKLQSDLITSMNAAVHKSQSIAAQKMKDMTGLNLPGF